MPPSFFRRQHVKRKLNSIWVELSPHVLFSEEAWRNCLAKRQNKEFFLFYSVVIPEKQTVLKFELG